MLGLTGWRLAPNMKEQHCLKTKEVLSVMGRDDSWPATVPSVVPSLRYSLSQKATWKHPKWQNCTSDHESDSRFWIGKAIFLVTICLSRLVLEIFACDRQRDEQTTWTITIAGPHIVADQLIITGTQLYVRYYDKRHICYL